MVREIPLTQGQVAIVDDEDYERVAAHKWYALAHDGGWYAVRSVKKPKRRLILMHRFILGLADGDKVDHVDGSKLNNRRSNLRPATHTQNMRNRKMHKNNSSGYKGVRFELELGRWRARIKVNRRDVHLGLFDDITDAARAYNEAARRYFGEFARLNAI